MPLELRPGDLIGFAGCSPVSRAINLGTWGWPFRWPRQWRGISHVAICVPAPDGPGLRRSRPLLFESLPSPPDGWPCGVLGTHDSGVQAHGCEYRCVDELSAGTVIWHYALRQPLSWTERRALEQFAYSAIGTPYDLRGAWRARALPIGRLKRRLLGGKGLHELFCSEFVAACWERCRRPLPRCPSWWAPNQLCRHAVRAVITHAPRLITEPDLRTPSPG
jgi:hypothetical protein